MEKAGKGTIITVHMKHWIVFKRVAITSKMMGPKTKEFLNSNITGC